MASFEEITGFIAILENSVLDSNKFSIFLM